jgi:hypothetical protein
MGSTLSWIDHDPAERDRMQRVLQLFRERDTRDELGLGGVRDAFADTLFPGTSTIQTRLRYFLFVPWVYAELERRRIPAGRFSDEAREQELEIRNSLLESDDTTGVFGKEAGRELKRLSSSVYWAGLKKWGLRRFDWSQDEYHRTVDSLYERRRVVRHRDDGERITDPSAVTWNPEIPHAPDSFPGNLSLQLENREAQFLRDLVASHCKGSLLAVMCELAEAPVPDIEFPWQHPDLGSFSAEHRSLLEQARLFSGAMNGAAILYNGLLAECAGNDDLRVEHAERLASWAAGLDHRAFQNWQLGDLWHEVLGRGHRITALTQRFVTDWVSELVAGPAALLQNDKARQLIRERERRLKGARSRFTNQRALDQWGGSSGITPLNFRWQIVRQLLGDLHAGLKAE